MNDRENIALEIEANRLYLISPLSNIYLMIGLALPQIFGWYPKNCKARRNFLPVDKPRWISNVRVLCRGGVTRVSSVQVIALL